MCSVQCECAVCSVQCAVWSVECGVCSVRQKRLKFPTVRVLIIETSYERADFVVDNLFLYGPRRKHLAINQCFTPKIST